MIEVLRTCFPKVKPSELALLTRNSAPYGGLQIPVEGWWPAATWEGPTIGPLVVVGVNQSGLNEKNSTSWEGGCPTKEGKGVPQRRSCCSTLLRCRALLYYSPQQGGKRGAPKEERGSPAPPLGHPFSLPRWHPFSLLGGAPLFPCGTIFSMHFGSMHNAQCSVHSEI